jgi:glucose/arabinose dehydrogenase
MRILLLLAVLLLAMLLGYHQLESVGVAASAAAPSAPIPTGPRLQLRKVADGFARPVGVENAGDGSGRLFVIEQDGRIIAVSAAGERQEEPFLSMAQVKACDLGGTLGRRALGFDDSSAGNERGLLGLAFHPDFRHNGRAFIDFTDGLGDTVVAEFRARTDGKALDPGSCHAILRVDQTFPNHNGGNLEFDPGGRLVIGFGDGGSGNDPCNHASTAAASALRNDGRCAVDPAFVASGGNADSRALLGKFVRIDIDHATPSGKHGLCAARADGSADYAAPADNAPGACPETWTLGWRNPWRYSFDPATGALYVGDVGQNQVEEVSRVPAGMPAGGHFGWRGCEGDRDNAGGHCAGTQAPLLTYRHDGGRCSITGGAVYRGAESTLSGKYLFGDYCSGEVFVADPANGRFTVAVIEPADALAFGITSFGEDERGNLYVVHHGLKTGNGAIYEIKASR